MNRGRRRSAAFIWTLRLIVLMILLGMWQLLPHVDALRNASPIFDPFFVSSPTRIAQRIYDMSTSSGGQPSLWPYLRDTLVATFLGVVIGSIGGVILGLILSNSDTTQRVARPFVTLLNATPRIALVPIFVIIAGPTTTASVMTAIALVLFIVFYNAYAGGISVPAHVLENANLLGASRLEIMRQIRLPYVLVWTFAALPNAISFGLVAVITAELLAGTIGLGQLLLTSISTVDSTLTFAVVVIASIVGVILVGVSDAVQRRVLHWWIAPQ